MKKMCLILSTACAIAASGVAAQAQPVIEDNAVVLFQGDSVTDGFRNAQTVSPARELGFGYVMMAASFFQALHPQKKVTFINRGRSGDTIKRMKARWQRDCLDLKPTWVSIMIGVNDTCRFCNPDPEKQQDSTSIQEYEATYRELLTQTREQLNARFILMEPYMLPLCLNYQKLHADLDQRIAVIHRLAKEFDAILVPTDEIMRQAAALHDLNRFWTLGDGCHPSQPGNALIALSWLRAVGAEVVGNIAGEEHQD